MPFLEATEHFSENNGAFRWSGLVGKQKHNVQRPTYNMRPLAPRGMTVGTCQVVLTVESLAENPLYNHPMNLNLFGSTKT